MASMENGGPITPVRKLSKDSPVLDKELPSIPELRLPDDAISGEVLPKPSSVLNNRIQEEDEEAANYFNGGLPHDDVAPVRTNPHTSTQSAPALLDQDCPHNGVPQSEAGAGTPPLSPTQGRRSVQFSRSDVLIDIPGIGGHSRNNSTDQSNPSKSRAFMSRLKALAAQGGLPAPRVPGANGFGSESAPQSASTSPTMTRNGRLPSGYNDEGSDVDADAEETADESGPAEGPSKQKKKKRRMRRAPQDTQSTPNTPRIGGSDLGSPSMSRRYNILQRRATMPDPDDHRGGLSEGEGRDRLAGGRRGSSWLGRSEEQGEGAESPAGPSRRPGHVRRITMFGGGVSDGDAMTPRRPFFSGDRASTFGVQKWRQVKNTLKLLRQKKDVQIDYYKSAELMAELRAGAPAVLMLASMIQRDEHGNKRIPVLLEQLKLTIRDSTPIQGGDSERHWLFTLNLEYGSGPSRMTWTVKRTVREILNMHWKYKLARSNDKYLHAVQTGSRPKQPKQPHFPVSAFPYVRGLRGVDISDEEDAASVRGDESVMQPAMPEIPETPGGEATAGEGTATDAEGRPPTRRKKSRMAMLGLSRRSSAVTGPETQNSQEQAHQAAIEEMLMRRRYVERQQKMLEKYMQEMIRWLMFRADSNRLCRFLELSALGVRLAAEGSYHGKECFLHIQSSKGLDFRRALTPGSVIERHSRKWFLVRQSYIVCVESPENMNIYDVYLVDSRFKIISKNKPKQAARRSANADTGDMDLSADQPAEKHHNIKLYTSERKVKFWARNQHLIQQFEDSITDMLKITPWHQTNRFESFAPARPGVFAQWLVDGRDYMWMVSRAISMAKDVIYIHDWWLSPELYMRRPAAISQKWRLDRLLKKKASEGVKIFVIVYRNVEAAIPIDSEYTKLSLLNLHPNIFVQRSPNQVKKNQFFFAHHEKTCIVDHDIAFVGGIDLCFGRWDSPQHPLTDDKPTGFEEDGDQPKDAEHCQLWPGKDYSNPRVQDFHDLREPYKEMYDRTKVPRMPWHDVSMQVVGQPARDLTRHFVQRWNYLRRGRKATRPTPFLLPPPDHKLEDLEALGLTGTCEVQILRSAGGWSTGIDYTETSIQNAYLSMIEESEHFVYIENQFFITSTETMGTRIHNRIGDALVERIFRAHENDEEWRCVIIMPLLPGFESSVADQDGTSVRLICQCQYRSICRGDHSIFSRLRAAGIEPEDYIQFFSLRQWGKIGPQGTLTTEQLYIHAKIIIVDDRVALIGSANINERSMNGDRDSELAAIVRDRDMIWSTMAGQPYQVGRFAHTLRLRLMREHLGLDTDEIMEEERQAEAFQSEMDQIYDEPSDMSARPSEDLLRPQHSRNAGSRASINRDVDLQLDAGESSDSDREASREIEEQRAREANAKSLGKGKDVAGYGDDHWNSAQQKGLDSLLDSTVIDGQEVLLHNEYPLPEPKKLHQRPADHHQSKEAALGHSDAPEQMPPVPGINRRSTDQLGLPRANQLPTIPPTDDTDIGGPPLQFDKYGQPIYDAPINPLAADIKLAHITKDCMRDPLNPNFYEDVWMRVAENNTKLFRRVFRCMPDSEVTNWHEFQEFENYARRFQESQGVPLKSGTPDEKSAAHGATADKGTSGGAGIGAPSATAAMSALTEKINPLHLHHSDHGQGPKLEQSGTNDDFNEKEPFPDVKSPVEESKPEMEKAAALDNALKSQTELPAEKQDFLQPNEADKNKDRRTTFSTLEKPATGASNTTAPLNNVGSVKRRRRATTKGSRRGFHGVTEELLSKVEAEDLCKLLQGHLVSFPYDWLSVEEGNGNWLYQVDQISPLQIYT